MRMPPSEASRYRVEVFDFANIWRWANDAVPIVTVHGHNMNKMHSEGKIPTPAEFDFLFGSWANELFNYGNYSIAQFMNKYYYFYYGTTMAATVGKSPVRCPYGTYEMAAYGLGCRSTLDTSTELLQLLNPNLYEIPRWTSREPNPYLDLDRDFVRKAQRDYDASWFGKTVMACRVPNVACPSPEWTKYTAAALCEWLVQNGVKLSVAGKNPVVVAAWKARNFAARAVESARYRTLKRMGRVP